MAAFVKTIATESRLRLSYERAIVSFAKATDTEALLRFISYGRAMPEW